MIHHSDMQQLEMFPETCSEYQIIRDNLLDFAKDFKNIIIANEYWPYNSEANTLPIVIGIDFCE